MKHALGLALLVLVLVPPAATAAPICPSIAGYDTYVALGAGGCQLGDKHFYNFAYTGVGSGGVMPIPSAGIAVIALDVPLFPGFQFQAGWAAGPGETMNSVIQFDVDVLPGGRPITDIHASMGGYGYSADGLVAVTENISGAFSGDLFLYDYSRDSLTSQTLLVNPATMGSLHVITDILVAGNSGVAVVSQVDNRFSEAAVPEPASLLLFGSGLAGVRLIARRRNR